MNWQLWAALFVKSAILIGASELVRRMYRRDLASRRHTVLLFTFVLLAALPLISIFVPAIHLPLWPSANSRELVTIQTTMYVNAGAASASRFAWLNWPLLIWFSGVLVVLLPVIVGSLAVRRMARRATPIREPESLRLVRELSSMLALREAPEVVCVDGNVTPLVLGFRRPRILLPSSCREWTATRLRVVLLHELAHIQRRDIASQVFAQAITALWWFQPLVWLTRRQLRRESEHSCDASAIALGVRPSEYASELLDIARELRWKRAWSLAAVAMARPSGLESRLLAILSPAPSEVRRPRILAAIALLTAVAITASAVTLTPAQKVNTSGGTPMKRSLLSGLLVSAGLSAATISGSLYDPSGAAIPDAKVSLYNPDTATNQQLASQPDGRFSFDNLPGGQYILRVQKPGFAALFRGFTLNPDTKIDRGLTLNIGSIQEEVRVQAQGTPAPQPMETGPKRLQIGGSVQAAKLLTKVNPKYPPSAKQAGIQGSVVIRTVILMSGTPGELTVLSSPSDDLSQASLDAVRQWRYSPTLLNGSPVEVVTDITVNFTLQP
jgi:TonB family protein